MKHCFVLVKGDEGLAAVRGWTRPELTITHEPATRSDLWAPAGLEGQPADLVVLSIEPEISHIAWRNNHTGQQQGVPAGQQLPAPFVPQGLLTLPQFEAHFGRLINQLKETGAKVVVLNVSSFDPQDKSHNYSGREFPPTIRRHQFNLALARLSISHDFHIVDVDRLVAAMGGGRHIIAPHHYSPQLQQAILQELERIAEQLGLFTETGWLKLLLPPTELQIANGQVVRWHKAEGQAVMAGEPLLDYQADKIVRTMRVRNDQAQIVGVEQISKEDWVVEMQLVAGQNGYLQRVLAPAGQPHPPTSPFALLSLERDPAGSPNPTTIPPFPASLHLSQ